MKKYIKKFAVLFALVVLLTPALALGQAPAPTCVGSFCKIGEKVWLPGYFSDGGVAGSSTFAELIKLIFNAVLLIVGSVATLFLVIGGFRYLTASGNEEAAEAAKKMMANAVVGLIVVIMSFAMIYIITAVLLRGRLGITG